jgi:hypothetical protein
MKRKIQRKAALELLTREEDRAVRNLLIYKTKLRLGFSFLACFGVEPLSRLPGLLGVCLLYYLFKI